MYVKADVVAEMLGISIETVWRLARQKKIPSYKIGGQRRFVIDEVVDSIKVEARSEGS